MTRRRPPERRALVRHKYRIDGVTVYVDYGEYEDGSLCEIFIVVAKPDTFTRCALDAIARTASLALQEGSTVETVASMMKGHDCTPQGLVHCEGSHVKECKSIMDAIAQEMVAVYGRKTDEGTAGSVEAGRGETAEEKPGP